jgi:hypothetical protein
MVAANVRIAVTTTKCPCFAVHFRQWAPLVDFHFRTDFVFFRFFLAFDFGFFASSSLARRAFPSPTRETGHYFLTTASK